MLFYRPDGIPIPRVSQLEVSAWLGRIPRSIAEHTVAWHGMACHVGPITMTSLATSPLKRRTQGIPSQTKAKAKYLTS